MSSVSLTRDQRGHFTRTSSTEPGQEPVPSALSPISSLSSNSTPRNTPTPTPVDPAPVDPPSVPSKGVEPGPPQVVPQPVPPRSPSPLSDSSDSSSSSDDLHSINATMSSTTASWVNPGVNKPPVVNARILKPHEYVHVRACLNRHLNHKDITDPYSEKARNLTMTCFQSEGSMNFFDTNSEKFLKLSSTAFDDVIKAHILGSDWVEIVTDTMDATRLDDVDERSFDNYFNTISSLNCLLKDSPGYRSDDSLKVLLQQNISDDFAHFLHEKKVLKSLAFTDWVEKATSLDADFRRFERPKLDRIALLESKLVEASKRSGASSHYDNGQARQRPFTPIENTSSRPPSSSSYRSSANTSRAPTNNNAFGVPSMAKVKEDPRQFDIYMKGEICRKCRNWKAGHFAAECNGEKPVLTVPYRTLMFDDLKFVENFFDKYRKPLTMDAVLARKSTPVAAVSAVTAESPVRDVDSFINGNSSSAVAALMGVLPVAHVRSGADVYSNSVLSSPPRRRSAKYNMDYHRDPSPIRKRGSPSRGRPTYMHSSSEEGSLSPADRSRKVSPVAAIIEDEYDDDYQDDLPGVQDRGAVTPPAEDRPRPDVRYTVSSCSPSDPPPLRIPHMFFPSLLDGPKVVDPLRCELLVDNGSHLVLIRDDLVSKLGLKRYRLFKPEVISVATSSSPSSNTTVLTEYVKLRFDHSSRLWSSRTVHAIIAPSLCSPVILGLPWLVHNCLVADFVAGTLYFATAHVLIRLAYSRRG
ncbi:hypothetical protein K435DRAFT_866508 [Dendrothele bispora CBS 962.96]|uniref:Uncharacterized protein n=1 Tax=Dendrothele bispora (strain CBS 962.96) TaxID=1314807 RepID=A0A4S8LGS1_DENBC|nr:hypothetical protein K435DRAFT_866508 [Dendrothele bispora CBS 962.96]